MPNKIRTDPDPSLHSQLPILSNQPETIKDFSMIVSVLSELVINASIFLVFIEFFTFLQLSITTYLRKQPVFLH